MPGKTSILTNNKAELAIVTMLLLLLMPPLPGAIIIGACDLHLADECIHNEVDLNLVRLKDFFANETFVLR